MDTIVFTLLSVLCAVYKLIRSQVDESALVFVIPRKGLWVQALTNTECQTYLDVPDVNNHFPVSHRQVFYARTDLPSVSEDACDRIPSHFSFQDLDLTLLWA